MKEQWKNIIVRVPDKKLSEPTVKVGSFDSALLDQIKKMSALLKEEGGIGLAANQIGINNRVLVTEFNDPDNKESIPFHSLVNPEIVELSPEENCIDEGCLSIPPIELPVDRSMKIKVKAQNSEGKKIKLTAKGLFARVLQHEIDHLNGILFTDRVREKFLLQHPYLKQAKIIFIGSGDFAETILKGLLVLGLNVPIVITESPKPAGRNRELKSTPVSKLAEIFDKKLIETENISNETEIIKQTKPDLIILSDFGQKIPDEILKIPAIAPLNLHPSLLPKFRGSTPIQTAILNGETETGVSLMQMTGKIDQGPVLAQIKTEIFADDNSLTLEERLAVLSVKLLYEVLPKVVELSIEPLKINNEEASYTKKFAKDAGEIDWEKSPTVIDRQIRALFPWPGSFTFIDGKRFLIHQAHLIDGGLVLDIVQPEGRSIMSFTQFLKGYKGEKPQWFNKIRIE